MWTTLKNAFSSKNDKPKESVETDNEEEEVVDVNQTDAEENSTKDKEEEDDDQTEETQKDKEEPVKEEEEEPMEETKEKEEPETKEEEEEEEEPETKEEPMEETAEEEEPMEITKEEEEETEDEVKEEDKDTKPTDETKDSNQVKDKKDKKGGEENKKEVKKKKVVVTKPKVVLSLSERLFNFIKSKDLSCSINDKCMLYQINSLIPNELLFVFLFKEDEDTTILPELKLIVSNNKNTLELLSKYNTFGFPILTHKSALMLYLDSLKEQNDIAKIKDIVLISACKLVLEPLHICHMPIPSIPQNIKFNRNNVKEKVTDKQNLAEWIEKYEELCNKFVNKKGLLSCNCVQLGCTLTDYNCTLTEFNNKEHTYFQILATDGLAAFEKLKPESKDYEYLHSAFVSWKKIQDLQDNIITNNTNNTNNNNNNDDTNMKQLKTLFENARISVTEAQNDTIKNKVSQFCSTTLSTTFNKCIQSIEKATSEVKKCSDVVTLTTDAYKKLDAQAKEEKDAIESKLSTELDTNVKLKQTEYAEELNKLENVKRKLQSTQANETKTKEIRTREINDTYAIDKDKLDREYLLRSEQLKTQRDNKINSLNINSSTIKDELATEIVNLENSLRENKVNLQNDISELTIATTTAINLATIEIDTSYNQQKATVSFEVEAMKTKYEQSLAIIKTEVQNIPNTLLDRLNHLIDLVSVHELEEDGITTSMADIKINLKTIFNINADSLKNAILSTS